MIGPFRGEWRFLSNFWLEPRRRMLSNEHFYQSAKALNIEDRALIMHALSPREAKELGKTIVLRPDWDAVRDTVMLEGLRTKFYSDETLAEMLLATGDETLVELNHWGDTYWGVDATTSRGTNRLGELLMQVRRELTWER